MVIVSVFVAALVVPTAVMIPVAANASPEVVELSAATAVPRDPFLPFSPKIEELKGPRSPLERIELGSLSLKAVILGTTEPRGLVEDDSGRGYSLRIGTRVGTRHGVVTAIESDRVVVQEETVDFYGEKQTNTVVLKLPTEEAATAR